MRNEPYTCLKSCTAERVNLMVCFTENYVYSYVFRKYSLFVVAVTTLTLLISPLPTGRSFSGREEVGKQIYLGHRAWSFFSHSRNQCWLVESAQVVLQIASWGNYEGPEFRWVPSCGVSGKERGSPSLVPQEGDTLDCSLLRSVSTLPLKKVFLIQWFHSWVFSASNPNYGKSCMYKDHCYNIIYDGSLGNNL